MRSFRGLAPDFERVDEHFCRAADRIWTAGSAMQARLAAVYPGKVRYVPNGVDVGHFGQACRMRSVLRPKRVLGYVGALKAYFDAELIRAVAKQLRDWTIVLIGPAGLSNEQKRALRVSNVVCEGFTPYEDLPRMLARFTVAAVPFTLTPQVLYSSPTKLMQYLAAGLPVVSTRIPQIETFVETGCVSCADSPEQFAVAASEFGRQDLEEACARTASDYSWESIFAKALADVPGLAVPAACAGAQKAAEK